MVTDVDKDMDKLEPPYMALNEAAALEKNLAVPEIFKHRVTI